MHISIVLWKPAHPGNLGAVARVMANFGFTKLILIDPECSIDQEAKNRAKHAQSILENVVISDEKILERFDMLIATSGKLGSDYNIPRIPLTPAQLAENIGKYNCALVFGPEDSGLTNEQLKRCDLLVHIPASKEYPIFNLSHAVGILLYELFKKNEETTVSHISSATKKEKELLVEVIEKKLKTMEFTTEDKRETQRKLWKKIIGKSFLTKREAQSLIGFLKKI